MAFSFNDVKTICQEALSLLRQDPNVITEANWNSGTPVVVAKTKLACATAVSDIIESFEWRNKLTEDNIPKWSPKVRNACVYLLARELAIPVAGRLEDMKTMDAIYRDKLTQAKLTDLNKTLSFNNDPILAQLVANFKADDPALVTAYSVYSQRITAVRDTSMLEVKSALKLEDLDELAMGVVESLVVSKLALACGFDANLAQLKAQEYNGKLAEYRRKRLNEELAKNDDPILAQLLANFKGDDAGLVNAYDVYTKRADSVRTDSENTIRELMGLAAGATLTGSAKDASISLSVSKLAAACGLDANFAQLKAQEYQAFVGEAKRKALENVTKDASATSGMMHDAIEEVKVTLGVTTLDSLGLAAAEALCYARNGANYGFDANFVQIKEAEYSAKIQECRKVKLNKALEGNEDPVLAELMLNFRSDDPSLTNAFEIYLKRVSVVKATAQAEINVAHDWRTPFDHAASAAATHVAYPAWIVLCASKLAAACGLDANHVSLYEQKYQARLREARAADLDAAKATIVDCDTKEVLAMISTNFIAADATLPRNISALTDRIDTMKSSARKEVLLAQDWNFAKVVKVEDYEAQQNHDPDPDEMPYVFKVDYPTDALRLVAVFGFYGKLAEWKIEDGMIKSREPIVKVKYTKDVEDEAKWSVFFKRAYIHRLAADVARTIMNNASDAQLQESKYLRALEDAKLRDTRESATPTDAWGDNYYVRAMQQERPEGTPWR